MEFRFKMADFSRIATKTLRREVFWGYKSMGVTIQGVNDPFKM
jgi:hypothetical protein